MSSFIKLLLMSVLLTKVAYVGREVKTYVSPHDALRAVVIPVGKKGFEEQESRVEIRRGGGRLLRWRSFASGDGEHGRGVNHAAWTSDGQFFVFNADSSGGHQPWNLATYFYSRRQNRFYSLDSFIGPITSDFTLEGRNTVRTTRFNFVANEEKERVRVRLDRLGLASESGAQDTFRPRAPAAQAPRT